MTEAAQSPPIPFAFRLRDGFARMAACKHALLSHAVKVCAFCLCIATVLWLARSDMRFDMQLAYSFGNAFVAWVIIDGGRFFIDPQSPYQFPRGWKGVALIIVGALLGHVLGTLLGDVYSDRSTWSLLSDKPRRMAYFLAISAGTGVMVSYFFYAQGKSAWLITELQATRQQTTEAQLRLLQSQLQPHMLFNSLANLRALINTDPLRATAMLDRFNDYLRATLSASRQPMHPLADEFDRLRDYLELMAMRMGPRLAYTLDLPDDLRAVPIPPLLLQSLVENAIAHGLEPYIAGGQVTVRVRSDGALLTIEIEDNGAGYAALTESATLPPVDSSKDLYKAPNGFGISQVRERLANTYGDQGAIKIIAVRAGGTLASVQFPVQYHALAAPTGYRHA